MGNKETHESDGYCSGEVLLQTRGELAAIFLGHKDEKIVYFSPVRLASLERALLQVRELKVKGLIILGANEQMFAAGAELPLIGKLSDKKEAEDYALAGQRVLGLLDDLSCTTVAAISGSCFGHGLELALCCDYRLSVDTPSTRIGFPESQLNLIPCFGGAARLSRLVGIKKAYDLIRQGRVLTVSQASDYGLLDHVVDERGVNAYGVLKQTATSLLSGQTEVDTFEMSLWNKFQTFSGVGRSFAISKLHKLSEREEHWGKAVGQGASKSGTRSVLNNRSQLLLLDSIVYSLKKGDEEGAVATARAFREVVLQENTKSLLHLHALRDAAAKIGRSLYSNAKEASIAVIGDNKSAVSISAGFLANGNKVVFLSEGVQRGAKDNSERMKEEILRVYKSRGARGQAETRLEDDSESRLGVVSSLSGLAACDIVVYMPNLADATSCQLALEMMGNIGRSVRLDATMLYDAGLCLLADLEGRIENPKRVIGMSFPSYGGRSLIAEIVWNKNTGPKSLMLASALVFQLGKLPVVVEDSNGLIVERLALTLIDEALNLLVDGYPVLFIDRAFENFYHSGSTRLGSTGLTVYGSTRLKGPFKMLDELGIDTFLSKLSAIRDDAGRTYSAEPDVVNIIEKMVASGRLGVRAGRGFYDHSVGQGLGHSVSFDDRLYDMLGVAVKSQPKGKPESQLSAALEKHVADRLLLRLVNEAVRILDAGIAGVPGSDAAGQIDLASVYGLGFPSEVGGILHFAQAQGVDKVEEYLTEFERNFGDRFHPSRGILQRASTGKSFYEGLGDSKRMAN